MTMKFLFAYGQTVTLSLPKSSQTGWQSLQDKDGDRETQTYLLQLRSLSFTVNDVVQLSSRKSRKNVTNQKSVPSGISSLHYQLSDHTPVRSHDYKELIRFLRRNSINKPRMSIHPHCKPGPLNPWLVGITLPLETTKTGKRL